MSLPDRPPALRDPAPLHMPPVQRVTLGCGLQCHLVEHRGLPVVDVRLVIRGGATLDEPATAGRSFLLADMLDQGTVSRSATRIADEAELIGATLETRATWDAIAIGLHVLTPRLRPAMELLADIALQPTFAEDELERRRRERMAAIMHEHAEPRILASLLFHRHAFDAASPFSAPLGGTADSIARLTRHDLTRLYAESFTPDNAFLVFVGDVRAAEAVTLLESLFHSWPAAGAGSVTNNGMLPLRGRTVHIVDRPGAPQSEIRVGLPGPSRRTADYFPLLVANTVLGGTFSSRLNMRLREEKAYTYGAGSSFALRRAGGPFVAATAVATAATADAVNDMVAEIARMSGQAVPELELERARRNLVLGLPRTFETTADIAEHVGEVALHGLGADYYDRYADAVRAVTAAQVQEASARWLKPDHLTIAVAGDAAVVRAALESLNLGAVHVHESI
jgi:zinc protease